jgi:hypothetical protein
LQALGGAGCATPRNEAMMDSSSVLRTFVCAPLMLAYLALGFVVAMPPLRRRVDALKHKGLIAAIIVPLMLCAAFTLAGLLIVFLAPDESQGPIWGPLKEIGPAVAGFWVLAAGLLAITAAAMTILVATRDSERRELRRREAIRQACVGEIRSFWDFANQLALLPKLNDHISWVKRGEQEPSKPRDSFRRNLGDEWFLLFRLEPLAIAELGAEIGARYLSLSGRARVLINRFNWMNGVDYKKHNTHFWVKYLEDTHEVLLQVFKLSQEMLVFLGDTSTDLSVYRFHRLIEEPESSAVQAPNNGT